MYSENSSEKIHYMVGQRILEKRRELGYTGFQLAQLLGVSQQQISRYERGKIKIDLFHLFKLSFLMRTPIDWFLEDISSQLTENGQLDDIQ
ncbi:helix-turn-helix transcriptional regulator [Providencia rettgeri]|uniref:helix-turn-helix domain-containing protein n=1 Tax=Providencia TaxID=586 RepID=UPI001CFE0B4B|nr:MULTISPECIES: helix-turn-helix transcriptional regulator [Providencia]EIU7555465.1 helix-turn-helix transcriptional regulator [Providencia rettgeri]MCB4839118.1 helix-turn-helix transcriptional regulator [Providencia rettgeri]MCG5277651.1 helix-turn-helix transcriptional regulator [Providencia rettgeri]MCG9508636.1 helix-turn-helix transcriptional regulator [Providencia rettgeri]